MKKVINQLVMFVANHSMVKNILKNSVT